MPALTTATVEEVTAAFATIAGQENAARLQQLLQNVMQHQSSSTQAADPSANDAASIGASSQAGLEVDLLPVQDKDTRKVTQISAFADLNHQGYHIGWQQARHYLVNAVRQLSNGFQPIATRA